MSAPINQFFDALDYVSGRVVVRHAYPRPKPVAGIGFSAAINDFTGVVATIPPGEEHCAGVVLDGSGVLATDLNGRARRMAPRRGAFNLLPADEGMLWDVSQAAYLSLCVHFDRGAIESWLDGAGPPIRLRSLVNEPDEDIRRVGEAIASEILTPTAPGPLLVEGLVLQFAALIARRAGDRAPPAPVRGGLGARELRELEEMMMENLAEGLSLEDLARHVGRSRFHFARAFKRSTGLSPHAFQMRLRLERARALLAGTTKPLAEIALDCGFSSQSHMTEAFTRALGEPPGAYRRRLRGVLTYDDPA